MSLLLTDILYKISLSLCMCGIFSSICCRLLIFSKLTFSKKYFKNTIRVSIVGILTFMSIISCSVEHEKSFIFLGPDLVTFMVILYLVVRK